MTMYDSGVPPVVGAVTVTVAEASPATAVGVPGTPGRAAGYGSDAAEVPTAFVAVRVYEYLTFSSAFRPVTTHSVVAVSQVMAPGSVVTW